MIFVDTSFWFANLIEADYYHQAAVDWFKSNTQSLVVSDYIVDELLTLLRSHDENAAAIRLGDNLFHGRVAKVIILTQEQIRKAWDLFRNYTDKDWSFTDCTSFVLIQDLKIQQAASFDHHFRQFGRVNVVP